MKVITQSNLRLNSADQVLAFIKDLEQAYLLDCSRVIGTERRAADRMNVTMPVRVTALDDQLEPLDYHYHAVTRNISTTGVGLVTNNPIRRSHVLLTFEPYHGDVYSVVAEVVYCGDVGYYFQIGCEFLAS
jgi:phage terminase large subunit-like protein